MPINRMRSASLDVFRSTPQGILATGGEPTPTGASNASRTQNSIRLSYPQNQSLTQPGHLRVDSAGNSSCRKQAHAWRGFKCIVNTKIHPAGCSHPLSDVSPCHPEGSGAEGVGECRLSCRSSERLQSTGPSARHRHGRRSIHRATPPFHSSITRTTTDRTDLRLHPARSGVHAALRNAASRSTLSHTNPSNPRSPAHPPIAHTFRYIRHAPLRGGWQHERAVLKPVFCAAESPKAHS